MLENSTGLFAKPTHCPITHSKEAKLGAQVIATARADSSMSKAKTSGVEAEAQDILSSREAHQTADIATGYPIVSEDGCSACWLT
jgi:hypothetical protein